MIDVVVNVVEKRSFLFKVVLAYGPTLADRVKIIHPGEIQTAGRAMTGKKTIRANFVQGAHGPPGP